MLRSYQAVPSITTGQVAVDTSPLLVVGENPTRIGVAVSNLGPATVFIGTLPTVSTVSGFALGSGLTLDLDNPTALYVVAAATGSTVSYMEESA